MVSVIIILPRKPNNLVRFKIYTFLRVSQFLLYLFIRILSFNNLLLDWVFRCIMKIKLLMNKIVARPETSNYKNNLYNDSGAFRILKFLK